MRTTHILATGAVAALAAISLGGIALAGTEGEDAEAVVESLWENHVGATTPDAIPGTLSCAIGDSEGSQVATCYALAGADGAASSVVVGRSTSTDAGATWSEFEPVELVTGGDDPAVVNPAEGGFPMPDAVGMDLQSAQDLLQEIAGNWLYYSSSEDATGDGRMQLIDSNWVVCSQNVAAGATVTDDINVIFYVVKDDESCP